VPVRPPLPIFRLSCLVAAGLLISSTVALAKPVASVQVLPEEVVWKAGAMALPDWPGSAPAGTPEDPQSGGERLFNVTTPTYQAFLPPRGKATGAGVVVAPGGGFRFLSMRNEGTAIARWLAEHGVAGFVLKYRTVWLKPGETPEQMRQRVLATLPNGSAGDAGAADGEEALRQIRAKAARYGVDPRRVGVVGFSAGGHVAGMMALHQDPTQRPSFAGLIYGMPFRSPPPSLPAANLPFPEGTPKEPWLQPPAKHAPDALPPHFLVLAQDDVIAGLGFRVYYDALYKAGYRPETHLYQRGGHGFGADHHGNTTDNWLPAFLSWMEHEGFLSAKPKAP